MTDRLAKFTPTSGLDRDAILFAAGKRSGRGTWVWKIVAGLLAVSQAATLCVLWPRDVPAGVPGAAPQTAAPVVKPVEPAPSPPPDIWTASSTLDVVQAAPKSSPVEFVLSGPPLTVWSGHRFD